MSFTMCLRSFCKTHYQCRYIHQVLCVCCTHPYDQFPLHCVFLVMVAQGIELITRKKLQTVGCPWTKNLEKNIIMKTGNRKARCVRRFLAASISSPEERCYCKNAGQINARCQFESANVFVSVSKFSESLWVWNSALTPKTDAHCSSNDHWRDRVKGVQSVVDKAPGWTFDQDCPLHRDRKSLQPELREFSGCLTNRKALTFEAFVKWSLANLQTS